MSVDTQHLRRLGHQHRLPDAIEAADELEHLRQTYNGGIKWRDGLLGMATIARVSDQSVQLTFPSCRMASAFEALAAEIEETA